MNSDAVLAANFNCYYQIMRFYPNFGSQTFCFWLKSLLPTFLLLKDSITTTIKDIYKSAGEFKECYFRESDRTFILSINPHIEAESDRLLWTNCTDSSSQALISVNCRWPVSVRAYCIIRRIIFSAFSTG